MPDNKISILQRLEAGEITAEEALNLMNQLGDSGPQSGPVDPRQVNPNRQESYGHRHNQSHGHHDHHEPDWAGGIADWVSDLVEEISGGIADLEIGTNLSDIFNGTYGHNKRTVSFVSQPVLQGLTQLEINGKNDKVEIYAYDGDTVQIHCDYNTRYPGSYVEFHEDNGHVALWFDNKAMRSVRVICQVPRVRIEHLHVFTKNDRIYLGGVTARDIHLETTNAKITAEDINAHSFTLKTTNAGIKTARLDVEHLAMKTTNARLKLEDTLAGAGYSLWESERTLEAHTTNGGIKFHVPEGTGLNVEAHTTDSKVTCQVPLYRTDGARKNRLSGESMDYAAASRRLKAKLSTTNGSIKIFAE